MAGGHVDREEKVEVEAAGRWWRWIFGDVPSSIGGEQLLVFVMALAMVLQYIIR